MLLPIAKQICYSNGMLLIREIGKSITAMVNNGAVLFQNSELLLREMSSSRSAIVVDKKFYLCSGIKGKAVTRKDFKNAKKENYYFF